MKRIIIALSIIVFTISITSAQNKYRYRNQQWKKDKHKIFLSAGASNFYGELGGANKIGSTSFSLRDFDVQTIRPAFQLGYMYRFSKYFASRSSFDYVWLSGNDKWTNEIFRKNRNLNFRTPIYGLSSSIVFLYEIKQKGHQYNLRGVTGWRNWVYTPYIQAGVGAFYFNSKGKYNGSWYKLKPLTTEGEGLVPTRKKYSSFQFTVPLAIGIRVKIAKAWEVGLEYGQWITFTDYIDDASTTYFDPAALLAAHGQNSVNLANPSNALPASTTAGQQRGDPRDHDHFIGLFFTVYYSIDEGYIPKLRF